MRGETERQATLMLGLTPDGFVPRDHPLRRIKPLVDSALGRMSPLFDEVYAAGGRPSIPPEHLLKSSLLMACYTIRSERQFCEQLRYNILFKWFLDLNVEDEPFHPTTFTKNRERLLEADAARVLLKQVVSEARRRRLLSADHFTVDGTLLEAWASHKNYNRLHDRQACEVMSVAEEQELKAWTSLRHTMRNVLLLSMFAVLPLLLTSPGMVIEAQSATVSGRILSADGRALIGAQVSFWTCGSQICDETIVSSTAQDGSFSFVAPTTDYLIAFRTAEGKDGYYGSDKTGHHAHRMWEGTWLSGAVAGLLITLSAEPEQLWLQVLRHDGTPAVASRIRACTTDGTWKDPGECKQGGFVDESGMASVDLPSRAFHISIVHEHLTWYYDDDSPGSLSRSPVNATTVTTVTATEQSPYIVTIPSRAVNYEFSYDVQGGIHLIGWIGDQITSSELFRQAPSVGAIAVLAPSGEHYYFASRFGNARRTSIETAKVDRTVIQHGDVLWLYVTRQEVHSIVFRTIEPRDPLILKRGTTFTAFAGAEATTLDQLAKGLGRAVTSIEVLDNRGVVTGRNSATPGDVLRVQLTDERVFLPYDARPPTVIYSRTLAKSERSTIEQTFQTEQQLLYDRFGVSARGLTIYWTRDLAADSGRGLGARGIAGTYRMWIEGAGLFAHEYFHVLQQQVRHDFPAAGLPRWLIEGAAQYAQWVAHHEGKESESRHIEDLIRRMRIDPTLADIRLSDPEHLFSEEWDVTYVLGEISVHWLVEQAEEEAVLELWRWNPRDLRWSWEAAFEHAG